MNNVTKTGFILSRRNLKDTDKIVTAYTRESGKISFVAKGIKKPTAKLQSHIEPLIEKKFILIGKSKLPVLVGVKQIEGQSFTSSIDSNIFGLFLSEVMGVITPQEMPNENLYEVYKKALAEICNNAQILLNTNIALLDMLSCIGIEPRVEKSEGKYYFSYSTGLLGSKKEGDRLQSVSPETAKLWHVLLAGNDSIRRRLRVESRNLMESIRVLSEYIEYHFERRLKSSKVVFDTWGALHT